MNAQQHLRAWTERLIAFCVRRPWTVVALHLVAFLGFGHFAGLVKVGVNVEDFFPREAESRRAAEERRVARTWPASGGARAEPLPSEVPEAPWWLTASLGPTTPTPSLGTHRVCPIPKHVDKNRVTRCWRAKNIKIEPCQAQRRVLFGLRAARLCGLARSVRS